MNPTTGEVERSEYVGSEPHYMRLTSDANYAWVSFFSIPFMRRINLNTFVVDKDIYLGPKRQPCSPGHVFSTIFAYNFSVLPNENNTLFLGLKPPSVFGFDAIALYKNDKVQPKAILYFTDFLEPNCLEPILQGSFLLGHCQTSQDNIFSRMKILGVGIEFLDDNDETGEKLLMRNYFKVHHDTVYNAQGYVLDATDSCQVKVLGQCKNDIIGDPYGFTYSEIHRAYIYPNINDQVIYLTFYDKHNFSAQDSVFLFEYPYNELMLILELEEINSNTYAVLIGKDYGEFTIKIVETELIGTDDLSSTSNVHVYPNPTKGKMVIEGLPFHNEISLYDITGKLLGTFQHDKIKAEIDMQQYPRGIMLLKVADLQQKKTSFITKIMLQ